MDGFTALVYASMWGHAEVVEVLIQQLCALRSTSRLTLFATSRVQ